MMNGGKLSHMVLSTSKHVCNKQREVPGERCARVLALSRTSNWIVFVFDTIARLFWQCLKHNGWLLADRHSFPDAFFKTGPLMRLPVFDGVLVALSGPGDGFLHAVTHLAHPISTVIGMRADSKLSFDHHGQSAAVPDLSDTSIG
jgi:hypothetical protein